MQNVRVTIVEPIQNPDGTVTMITKNPIVPEMAIPNFQRVFGQFYKGAIPVDENGNPVQVEIASKRSPKEIALNAMKQRAKDLKIKGWQLMGEDKLLEAIQKASLKSN